MFDLNTMTAALLALFMSAGAALAQNAPSNSDNGPTFPRTGTDAPTPGNSIGNTQLDQSTYDAFVDDQSTGSIRDQGEFMTRYQAMTSEEQAKVREACGSMQQEKTQYSDKVQGICKSISNP
ncbi:hypothetical protein [Phyllobacterium leguminum]|uniref:Uncharacterized protein n=1 Tax=Phyllobacterium leguminum TaxID=314237 RepID=A0A318THZ1_9HYPH|nr:hypothetical protein [Phyllobacterium leguminum]PYE88528.1 hypothetical protein C7477_107171 [Phyllobacterium leguminum]